jgi:hypothetical protein
MAGCCPAERDTTVKKTNDNNKPWWAALVEAALTTPRSWMPIVREHGDELGWMLDVAQQRAIEIDAPVEPVNHVRGYLVARLGRFPVHWSMLDHSALLYTAVLFLQAMERDMGPVNQRGTRFANAADSQELFGLKLRALFANSLRGERAASEKKEQES